MKYLFIALVLSCLFASAFAADCAGNYTEGDWDDSNELSKSCPIVTFTVDTSSVTNQTVIASVHLPDDEDNVSLTISYSAGTNNQTNSDDNEARICVPNATTPNAIFTVSSNLTSFNDSVPFSFYVEFSDDGCVEVSSPSSGFCCWGWVILGVVVVVLIIVIIAAVAGFMVWKKRQSHDKYIYDDA
eukprot:CAMPEP_0114604988 /NCGR_PEP_ID=MMETSP0168-20121206/826_1 /TAXON_ID=95228 ORGANISM="Vannella sp., Strain DIVA3 517/6/12" /NCGR_SAMPLE_ID=MMETSP0168 /ASSEMBLY_ACC=CAM_ASM_000044 /LENGTH=185 /DNA_ID=CAMNT_0001815831 /DNA_START=40 /DNA_END=597 /DNA_ORIENTATION=+